MTEKNSGKMQTDGWRCLGARWQHLRRRRRKEGRRGFGSRKFLSIYVRSAQMG